MKKVGGYFELHLNEYDEYHKNAIRLNTGRNALELILGIKKPKRLYIPFYTCDVLLEPLKKLNIKYEFYSINQALEPELNVQDFDEDETLLYTNYFGLKDDFIETLASKTKNLIIDNAQSFFSMPLDHVDTFYSPRKFFGVPDGAYLYTNANTDLHLEEDDSTKRAEHLLLRLSNKVNLGYSRYLENESKLNHQPIKEMSLLTRKILTSIDYDEVKNRRTSNYEYLEEKLGGKNDLKSLWNRKQIPMIYPYLSKENIDRTKLKDNGIYIAKYWPNVRDWVKKNSVEYDLYENLYALPIDHRYSSKDLGKVISLLN